MPVEIGGHKVLLIDTPGFDDTHRSDTEILADITRTLAIQYQLGVSLKGVIYVHRISDNRYSGAGMKTLNIFQKICGPEALKNVILATSRWNDTDETTGSGREQELRDDMWGFMLAHGSKMMRYYGDEQSALVMASQLLVKPSIILDIQREVVDQKMELSQTAAGAVVNGQLSKARSQHETELKELETLRDALREHDRAMMRQVTKEWERKEVLLEKDKSDQELMQQKLGEEVNQTIESASKRALKKGAVIVLKLLPAVISMLGMFVGFPSGCSGVLDGWFSESGGTGSTLADFFDNM